MLRRRREYLMEIDAEFNEALKADIARSTGSGRKRRWLSEFRAGSTTSATSARMP